MSVWKKMVKIIDYYALLRNEAISWSAGLDLARFAHHFVGGDQDNGATWSVIGGAV
jgi:hypothetical protein